MSEPKLFAWVTSDSGCSHSDAFTPQCSAKGHRPAARAPSWFAPAPRGAPGDAVTDVCERAITLLRDHLMAARENSRRQRFDAEKHYTPAGFTDWATDAERKALESDIAAECYEYAIACIDAARTAVARQTGGTVE